MITYSILQKELTKLFTQAGIVSAAVDSELLITELAGISRPEIFLYANELIPVELEQQIRELARRRANREPLQYLLKVAYFRDLKLEVTPAVLIPRPETELLVDYAIKYLPVGGSMLDLGTGSGAIALSMATERPDAQITAVDISLEALEVARRNAITCQCKVRFLHSNLFAELEGERFDLIGANLPYVSPEEYTQLEPEVRLFEPALALTAADNGFQLIERAAEGLVDHLNPGGRAIFELSPTLAPRLTEALDKTGAFDLVEVLKDYNQRDRFVSVRYSGKENH